MPAALGTVEPAFVPVKCRESFTAEPIRLAIRSDKTVIDIFLAYRPSGLSHELAAVEPVDMRGEVSNDYLCMFRPLSTNSPFG